MRKMAKRLNFLEFLFDFAQTIGYNLPCLKQSDAILAQLVEQLICNQQVVGSSPTNGSKTKTLENIAFQGFFFFSLETSNRAKIAKMVTIW